MQISNVIETTRQREYRHAYVSSITYMYININKSEGSNVYEQ